MTIKDFYYYGKGFFAANTNKDVFTLVFKEKILPTTSESQALLFYLAVKGVIAEMETAGTLNKDWVTLKTISDEIKIQY